MSDTEPGAFAPRYLPNVFDLERLFAGSRLVRPRTGARPDAADADDRERVRALVGFPHGSRVLLAGEAGSGKTTLALPWPGP